MEHAIKCWECGEKMKDKEVEYSLYGIKIGKFPAKVCEKCEENISARKLQRK